MKVLPGNQVTLEEVPEFMHLIRDWEKKKVLRAAGDKKAKDVKNAFCIYVLQSCRSR